ncbi:hypothetical protein MMC18_003053 [Xylographa bjoerkii]|nr:hypothetical protein [Xylographa bjoerkii]
MPVPSGGPRPTNTLMVQQNQPQSAIAVMKNGAGRAIGKINSLITSAVSGNTAHSLHTREPLSEVIVEERSAKRLKMSHKTKSQKFKSVDEIESDDDDELSTAVVRVEVPRRMNVRATPSVSLTSSTVINRPGVFREMSSEHRSLEAMMDSTPYARSRGRPPKMTSGMQSRDQETPSIDLTGNDSVHKQRYQGTARPGGRTRGQVPKHTVDKNTLSDTQSKFFVDSAHSQNGSLSQYPPAILQQPSGVHNSLRTYNLSDAFVPMDGTRRNSQSGISSDELAATSPIGNYATVSRLSSQQPLRKASQSPQVLENQKEFTPPKNSVGLESSNIKPTKFTDSVAKPKVTKLHSTRGKRNITNELAGFECHSIVIDNFYLESGQHGLGLVFDDKRESLEIYHNGQNLLEKNIGHYIPLLKIVRVTWSTDSPIVHLTFSRGEGYPSKVVVKFASEKLAATFLRRIQDTQFNARMFGQDGPHMDKLFINSIRIARDSADMKRNAVKDRDNELELLEKRKQRRDEKASSGSDTEQADSKRRRGDRKITDRLQGDKYLTIDPLALQTPLAISKRQERHRMLTYNDEEVSVSQPHTKIDRIIGGVLSTGNSPHITRSKASSGRGFNPPQGIPLLVDEFPEELRFSKKYGLGTRWKKPLIFPKIGKKKTTVEYDDLERLDDGQFLNDNLLGFYLRYLEYQLEEQRPDVAKKVYWFNTYFFASLTQTVRGKRGINYEAVRKWTRNIDIFTYDYAVVPINESAHWYVAIVCNLRALNRVPEMEAGDGPGSPQFEKFEALDDCEPELPEGTMAFPEDVESKETQDATNEMEKGGDEDATESFADLQLSEKEDRSLPAKVRDVNLEGRSSPQGLFKHVLELGPMPAPVQQLEPQTLGAETDSIVATGELAGRTPASQKKSKRRSIPPPRIFDPEQPAIITLDSLGIAHSPTIRVLKDYLHEEAKDKRGGMVFDDSQIKGITVKQIPLQDNFCDCGLFLLGYMDKFVEGPRDFVTKVLQREFDSTKDWPNLNPTAMRTSLRDLLQDLHAKQEGEREELKRTPAVKVSGQEAKPEQETPSSPTSKQTLPGTKSVGDDRLPRKGNGPKNDEHGIPTSSTRRGALQSALPIDEPDPLPHKIAEKQKQDSVGRDVSETSSNASFSTSKQSPIVRDSQEGVAQERSPDVLATESAENEPVELPMEIPESPIRPTTRGLFDDPLLRSTPRKSTGTWNHWFRNAIWILSVLRAYGYKEGQWFEQSGDEVQHKLESFLHNLHKTFLVLSDSATNFLSTTKCAPASLISLVPSLLSPAPSIRALSSIPESPQAPLPGSSNPCPPPPPPPAPTPCTGTEGTPTFRVSLFKRSAAVRVYQHLWAACSGSIEPTDASPLAAAQRELLEETGLAPPAIALLRAGARYEILDAALETRWTIWPFAWTLVGVQDGEVGRRMVSLDWEHTECRFVRPEEVGGMETVAHLERSLGRVVRGFWREGEGEGEGEGGEGGGRVE